MRGRKEAILIALLFLAIPYFDWVSVVIMALVTLRKGTEEGLWLLAVVTIVPTLVLVPMGYPLTSLILYVLAGSVVVWLFASLLRQTISWSLVIQAGAAIGLIAVIIVHGYVADVGSWWEANLQRYLQQAGEQYLFSTDTNTLKTWITRMSKVATGALVVGVLVSNLFNLAAARWLQALLYNPAGLGKELATIRMSLVATVALIVVVVVALLLGVPVFIDMLPVVVLPFFLAGLSVVHAWANTTQNLWVGLFGFYGLLILFFPYLLCVLVVLAVVDSWWDIRAHFLINQR